jgi:prevent-host-death family protein
MEQISTKQARDHLSDLINKVAYSGERFTLTRHGHGVAVIISLEEWRNIEHMLEQIEDEEDVKDADLAYAQYRKQGGVPFSKLKKKR